VSSRSWGEGLTLNSCEAAAARCVRRSAWAWRWRGSTSGRPLQSFDEGNAMRLVKEGVFAVSFLAAAPARIAEDVDVRPTRW